MYIYSQSTRRIRIGRLDITRVHTILSIRLEREPTKSEPADCAEPVVITIINIRNQRLNETSAPVEILARFSS
jgi:hypothetical protein